MLTLRGLKVGLLLFLIAIANGERVAANDDWVKFGSNSSQTSFLNFKTEVWEGNDIVSVWELNNLKKQGEFGQFSELTYWTFNCVKRSYVFRQIMQYDEKFAQGNQLSSASFPNREFKYPKPGSIADALMRFMCKL